MTEVPYPPPGGVAMDSTPARYSGVNTTSSHMVASISDQRGAAGSVALAPAAKPKCPAITASPDPDAATAAACRDNRTTRRTEPDRRKSHDAPADHGRVGDSRRRLPAPLGCRQRRTYLHSAQLRLKQSFGKAVRLSSSSPAKWVEEWVQCLYRWPTRLGARLSPRSVWW